MGVTDRDLGGEGGGGTKGLVAIENKSEYETSLCVSRPVPSNQPAFFPSDLILEFLESWRGLIVSSSDSLDFWLTTSMSDTGCSGSMRMGEEDRSPELERYLSS